MKKIICIILTIIICYSAVSCSVVPPASTEAVVPTVTPELTETPITELLSKIEYKIFVENALPDLDNTDTEAKKYYDVYDELFLHLTFDDLNVDNLPNHTKKITIDGKEIIADYKNSTSLTNNSMKPSGIIWDVYEAIIDEHECEIRLDRETSKLISFYDYDIDKYEKKRRINNEEAKEIACECIEQNFGKNVVDELEVSVSKVKRMYETSYCVTFQKYFGELRSNSTIMLFMDLYGNIRSFLKFFPPEFSESQANFELSEAFVNSAKEKLFASVPEGYKISGKGTIYRDHVTGKYYLGYDFDRVTSEGYGIRNTFFINIF